VFAWSPRFYPNESEILTRHPLTLIFEATAAGFLYLLRVSDIFVGSLLPEYSATMFSNDDAKLICAWQ
jgi:hypothetical protein